LDEGAPKFGACRKGILYVADYCYDENVDDNAATVLIDEYGALTAFRFLINENFGCNRFSRK
jgi:hypothetical protein